MAKVVMVHGAFNELWGPHEIKAKWLPALQDGLWHHDVAIDPEDVAVCFYGDLFRRDPEVDDGGAFERSRAGMEDMLREQLGPDMLAAIGMAANQAAFDRTLDLVTTLATREDLRDQVRARLERLVGPDTVVLVAHSLGTLVTYQALRAHDWEIPLYVTLGSPLGSPMVLASMQPPPGEGDDAWPGRVKRWVNVAAVGDKAAAVDRLAPRYGPRVEDHRVDNGHRAHDPEPYLNSAVTGRVIAEALRGE